MSPRSWAAGLRRTLTALSRRRQALGGALREDLARRTQAVRRTLRPVTETVTPAGWTVAALALALLVAGPLLHWRELLPGAEHAPGMVAGVKAAVYTFMSHII